ncbi:HK97 family phage prohead protease [Rhodococcoides fascians]|uniref:HK97 family phage prohead protease n=1 Tax=Rhodococcoides fascians TaxID=1828 RepID=UPI00055AC7D3|nr:MULTISPECIES: HK97 family phage prohead protease [Rhodococcus]OZF05563.1 phage major capsid protein [Rhodococcus sp. 15-1189-1-1a]OZF20347.1 phage major capsid protein [Rhodococcus sp. 14-2686-1-2]
MNESIITRSAPVLDEVEIRTAAIGVVDEQTRIISGIAVPFGQPTEIRTKAGSYQESFLRGAFDDNAPATVHANHSYQTRGDLPIGTLVSGKNRDDGYYVECRIANTARGDEVLELARDGVLKYFSVGFLPGTHETRDGVLVRTKATLREVSIVETPAYKGAVIESVRSAATEQDQEMTPEEIKALIEGHPEVTQLRADNETLQRRIGVLEDGGGTGTQTRTFKYQTAGEWLKALYAGETDAADEFRAAVESVETRAYEGQTLADTELQPAWMQKALKLMDERRPLKGLFTQEPLPSKGMSIEYPVVLSESGNVEKQLNEGDDLAYTEIKIGTRNAVVETFGAYTSLSRQLIERATIDHLGAALKYQIISYARSSELQVRNFFNSLSATVVGPNQVQGIDAGATMPDSGPEIIDLMIDAKAMIEDNTPGGALADFALVSRDVFKQIAAIVDSTGRPLFDVNNDGQNTFGTLNIRAQELGGSAAGIPFVVGPRLAANTFAVCAKEAITTQESAGAPFRLQDENVINLTKDFSVYGYQSIYSEQPKAIVKIRWGA